MRFLPPTVLPSSTFLLVSTNPLAEFPSWLRFCMLTKCILPSSKRKGRDHKQLSISKLCDLWEAGPVADLCTGLKVRAQTAGQGILSSLYQSPKSPLSECQRQIACSISLAQDGLLEEACRILCCNGIAKNSHSTFITLQSKHPTSPPLLLHPYFSTPTSPPLLLHHLWPLQTVFGATFHC